jgi:hypothetical protein
MAFLSIVVDSYHPRGGRGETGSIATLICDGAHAYRRTYYDGSWTSRGSSVCPYVEVDRPASLLTANGRTARCARVAFRAAFVVRVGLLAKIAGSAASRAHWLL